MRAYNDTAVVYQTDLQDQPFASKVIYLHVGGVIMAFAIDGVDKGTLGEGEGLEGYRLQGGKRETVVQFHMNQPWQVVNRDWLEVLTRKEDNQRELESVGHRATHQLQMELRATATAAAVRSGQIAVTPEPEKPAMMDWDQFYKKMGEGLE